MDFELHHHRASVKLRAGPFGLHLFQRDTGLNIFMDEVRIPPSQWARAPRQVSIALTNACDLACPYCYAPKSPAALDAKKLAEWLRELDDNGCLGVGFGGGEPTLHREFIQICRQTAERTRLAVTFTTHAHRISAADRDKLRGSVHYVRVSVDGVGPAYESLRGRPFSALRSQLAIIREVSPFGINFVVNACTLPHLTSGIGIGEEFGASEFLLLPEQPVAGTGGIDPTTLRALRQWIDRYRGGIPLAISENYSENTASGSIGREKGLRAYAHVAANGFLKRSSYDAEGVLIGSGGVMEALRRLEECPAGGKQP
ncbi:MAG TPA: radical SAM protein [Terriglobia bacterium]|nr:radical SAM protein [Terriglobia bacterium]